MRALQAQLSRCSSNAVPRRRCAAQLAAQRAREPQRACSMQGAVAAPLALDGFVARVQECNTGSLRDFVPFLVEDASAGLLSPSFAAQLCADWPAVFERRGDGVALSPTLCTMEARTEAVGACMRKLRDDGLVPGWRDEQFPVATAFDAEPLLLLERACAPRFGIHAYGVHVNCFTRAPDGRIDSVWVARRSRNKPTFPSMLDHAVAGGLGYGLSPSANVVKECEEEANVPAHLASQAQPAGYVSYTAVVPDGCKRDVLFVYDLELPPDFVPTSNDGEVEEFFRWPVERVLETVGTTQAYKPNCNIVLVDFFVRHGFIPPEARGYLRLVSLLRSGDVA